MKVARARRPSRDSCSYRPTIRGYSLRTCLLGHVAPFPLEEISNKRAGHLSQRVLPLSPQDSGESCGLSMFSSLTNLSLRLRDQSRANQLRSRSSQASECRALSLFGWVVPCLLGSSGWLREDTRP